jgi:hypothetical protein
LHAPRGVARASRTLLVRASTRVDHGTDHVCVLAYLSVFSCYGLDEVAKILSRFPEIWVAFLLRVQIQSSDPRMGGAKAPCSDRDRFCQQR